MQNARDAGSWRLPLRFQRKALECRPFVVGIGTPWDTPEVVCVAVKVQLSLQWEFQVVEHQPWRAAGNAWHQHKTDSHGPCGARNTTLLLKYSICACWTFDHWLMMLYWLALETLGDGGCSQEKVYCCYAFEGYPWSYPVSLLCFYYNYGRKVGYATCSHHHEALPNYSPRHNGTSHNVLKCWNWSKMDP